MRLLLPGYKGITSGYEDISSGVSSGYNGIVGKY